MSTQVAPVVTPGALERRHEEPADAWPQRLLRLLTTPVVYSLLVPFALLDLWTTAYQWVCFPVYGMPRVERAPYFVIDRHRLVYLDIVDKANCTFCSYAHGVLSYVTEVAARTEQYWCPIRHGRQVPTPHHRYGTFVAYGDADAYRQRWPALRRALRDEGRTTATSSPNDAPGPCAGAPRDERLTS